MSGRERLTTVRRDGLLAELDAHRDVPIVLIVGGAGYGKTTLLDQWCQAARRPVVRVGLRPRHDDGTALLGALLDALGELEPIAPTTRRRIVSGELDWSSVVLPTFARLLERSTVTATLVLDDVQFLQGENPRAVLDVLVHGLPDEWQLVLASRVEPALGVERLRADGRLWKVPPERLLMCPAESTQLVRALGVDLAADDLDALVDRTAGWPVAVSLSAVALRGPDAAPPGRRGALRLDAAGDDQALARYLREEVLQALGGPARDFLLRTSILEELEPLLCDAVLGRSDSGAMLARARARSRRAAVRRQRP